MSTKELKRLIQKFNADYDECLEAEHLSIHGETEEEKDWYEEKKWRLEVELDQLAKRIKAANPSRYMLQRYPELKDIMEYE